MKDTNRIEPRMRWTSAIRWRKNRTPATKVKQGEEGIGSSGIHIGSNIAENTDRKILTFREFCVRKLNV